TSFSLTTTPICVDLVPQSQPKDNWFLRMSGSRIPTLLAWCADNGIIIDPRIQVIEHDVAAHCCHGSPSALTENTTTGKASRELGICVYSCDQFIESPCTCESVPF